MPDRPIRIARFFAPILFVFLTAGPVRAQSNGDTYPDLTFGALMQAEATYGLDTAQGVAPDRSRVGFGLRRARFRVTARVGPKTGGFIHFDGDGGSFGVLDAYLFHEVTPSFRLRLGRMAGAQPRAFILTPLPAYDGLDRAAIAGLWNRGTLGTKGRDFGLDMRYRVPQAEVSLFLSNGDGSFGRPVGNYQESVLGDASGGAVRGLDDLAVSGYLAYFPDWLPGLEMGGFAGYNGARPGGTQVAGEGRVYVSYSAHLYWGAEPGSRPFRFKADVIGIQYEALSTVPSQQSLGASVLGAVALHSSAEFFGRAEAFDVDLDLDGERDYFLSTGVHFSPSSLRGQPFSRERITLGYSGRFPQADGAGSHHLVTLQVQINL